MNLPSSTATPTSTSSPSDGEICSDCGSKDAWIIHTVRLRGLIRSFCTHCLLRNHPSSFCPTCFVVYDSSPPHASRRVTCSKCMSMTHTQCIGDSKSPSYLCPPCRDPNSFSFFRPIVGANGARSVDIPLSEVFLCAAKIAFSSMTKAVQSSKSDAERRGREAALARKRAREQLEQVVTLDGKEKARSTGAAKVKEVEQKPKLSSVAASNGGAVKETESQSKNNGGESEKQQSQGLQLAIVKQEVGGGADASK